MCERQAGQCRRQQERNEVENAPHEYMTDFAVEICPQELTAVFGAQEIDIPQFPTPTINMVLMSIR